MQYFGSNISLIFTTIFSSFRFCQCTDNICISFILIFYIFKSKWSLFRVNTLFIFRSLYCFYEIVTPGKCLTSICIRIVPYDWDIFFSAIIFQFQNISFRIQFCHICCYLICIIKYFDFSCLWRSIIFCNLIICCNCSYNLIISIRICMFILSNNFTYRYILYTSVFSWIINNLCIIIIN